MVYKVIKIAEFWEVIGWEIKSSDELYILVKVIDHT
jgi:hypothetical protein